MKQINKTLHLLIFLPLLLQISCNYRGGSNNSSDGNFDSTKINDTPPIVSAEQKIKFKLYLERSGSMIAYDDIKCKGTFKHAIVTLLNKSNSANPNENIIYIVNNDIYPQNKTVSQFIQENNIFSSSKGVGDPSSTDFEKIFNAILKDSKDNQLSILVSDMIYSTKAMKVKNNEKIVKEAEGITNSIFNKYSDNYSVLILKLISDYQGLYYPYKSPSKGFKYNGDRPYYITFFGKNEVLNKVLKDDEFKNFRNFYDLEGFKEYYLFNKTDNSQPPFYTILPKDKNTIAEFRVARDNNNSNNRIISLEDIDINSRKAVFQLAVAVDLSDLFVDENYKTDTANYGMEPKNVFIISDIEPIKAIDIHPNDKKYLGSTTHLFIISAASTDDIEPELKISLKKKLPEWIIASSTIDDTNQNAKNFSTTSFGFEQLMSGIFNAYNPNRNNAKYFTINLYLKK